MAIKQKNVTITTERGRDDYLLSTIPASRGFALKVKLGKLLAPAFQAIETNVDAKGNAEVNIIPAVVELCEKMDSHDVLPMVKELVASAGKGSGTINFDTEFAGEYDKLYLLLKEIIEFNFGSVFTLAAIVGR